tara:strand:- start:127 stop:543 length:417 start_codon:yes stop_codon:yes gene_type:complete
MQKNLIFMVLLLSLTMFSHNKSYSNDEKKLYLISPVNGESVTSPVLVKFGVKGMSIVPAGVEKAMSGHHHLLINVNKLPDMSMPIPANKNYLHFGKGETETSIILPKGKHTLQLLLGDHMHVPHEPPLLSTKVEIIVE